MKTSNMDYEKKYKEAIERLKQWDREHPDGYVISDRDEFIFPELIESEDEKVRKALLEMVHDTTGDSLWVDYNVHKEDAIAWLEKQSEPTEINPSEFDSQLNSLLKKFEFLPKEELAGILNFYLNVVRNDGTYKEEKQGEQKSRNEVTDTCDPLIIKSKEFPASEKRDFGYFNELADKDKPKFHEGEWIIDNKNRIGVVTKILKEHYMISFDGREEQVSFAWESKFRKWDISDAKDGDVLFMDNGASNCIFIYKSFNNGIINKYASYNKFGFEGEHYLVLNDGYVIPASKEQRDTLMKAMADAGYTFDFEKKELKKIEQKPAMIQWKGDNLKEVIDFTGVYKEGFKKWFHNSWEEYEKYVHEHNNIFKIFNEDGSHMEVPVGAWVIKAPDGYNTASRFAISPILTELSIESNFKFKKAIECIENYVNSFPHSQRPEIWQHINFLKSFKGRVQPKSQSAEWSEEDIVAIDCAVEVLSKDLPSLAASIERLKSLRPQKQWRPSEMEMKALEFCLEHNIDKEGIFGSKVVKLYDELKKLKG